MTAVLSPTRPPRISEERQRSTRARRRRVLRSRISAVGLLVVTFILVAPILLMIKVSLEYFDQTSST